jgi:hypothetical protein
MKIFERWDWGMIMPLHIIRTLNNNVFKHVINGTIN